MITRASILITFTALFGVAGCTADGYPTDNTFHSQGKAPSSAPQPTTFAYRYPDSPPVLDVRGLQDFASRCKYRVVLLDFWASWSRQTREELTMLAKLQQDLEPEGFQVISCNLDPVTDWASTTVPILQASRANYPCVIVPPEAKRDVREWLAPNWTFDLPARFVINRQGSVSAQALANVPLEQVAAQVRQLVMNGTVPETTAVNKGTSASLRLKLIDIHTGEAQSLSEITADPADPADATRLADQAAKFLARDLDRTKNPRIAIPGFPDVADRKNSNAFGNESAKKLEDSLRAQGFFDLIGPAKSDRMLKEARLSLATIEFDPAAVKNQLGCDYLLVGWVKGAVAEPGRTRTVAQRPGDAP